MARGGLSCGVIVLGGGDIPGHQDTGTEGGLSLDPSFLSATSLSWEEGGWGRVYDDGSFIRGWSWVAHPGLRSGFRSPRLLGYLFAEYLLGQSPEERGHSIILKSGREHHKPHLPTFPPTCEKGILIHPWGFWGPLPTFSKPTLQPETLCSPAAPFRRHPPRFPHDTRPKPLAKPCLASPARAPREKSSPNTRTPVQMSHTPLSLSELQLLKLAHSAFWAGMRMCPLPPQSAPPSPEHSKMTMKGSSGRSPGATESGELREGLCGEAGLCLGNLSCHLRLCGQPLPSPFGPWSVVFTNLCSHQLFLPLQSPVSDLVP